jgi:Virulence-associated protein E-like domain
MKIEFNGDQLHTETAETRVNGNGNGHAYKDFSLEILMLAALPEAEYRRVRKARAKEFGIKLTGPGGLDSSVNAERKRIKADGAAAERQQRQARQNSPDWRDWPDVTNEGKVRARSQVNIEFFLKRQGVSLSFDLMAHRTLVAQNGETETLTDPLAKALWLEADRRGLPAKDSYFFAVLENLARKNSFHPVLDYLDGLQWDGVSRLDTWLHTYFGAENTELNSVYGRKQLIAGVRRVRQPGVKHDSMLVLQGKQGGGKSTAIKALCRDEGYFTDNLTVGADRQEIIELTAGKWIVELAELDGMNRREAGAIKAMLSRQVDEARLAYGRMKSTRPRQFVFFGTVNEEHYLRDATGNRRFWPVSVGDNVDPQEVIEGITRDRDQLWAEAAHYEARGESLELPKHLWAAAAEGQNERMITDPWLEKLSESDNLNDGRDFITSEEIYGALGILTERRGGEVGKRVASNMRSLGWVRHQQRVGNRRIWGFRLEPKPACNASAL